MSSTTTVLLGILVFGAIIGFMAIYSPQLSKWSHDKAEKAKSDKRQR